MFGHDLGNKNWSPTHDEKGAHHRGPRSIVWRKRISEFETRIIQRFSLETSKILNNKKAEMEKNQFILFEMGKLAGNYNGYNDVFLCHLQTMKTVQIPTSKCLYVSFSFVLLLLSFSFIIVIICTFQLL